MQNAIRDLRLTLVIPSLGGGGAERVMVLMANRWAAQGRAVTLITFDSTDSDRYSVSEKVTRVPLDVMRHSSNVLAAAWRNLGRLRRLRKAIRESNPDCVVSFIDKMNVAVLLACRKLRVPVVVSERIDPSRHTAGRVWSWLRKRTYPRAAAIVVQTESIRRVVDPIAGGRPIHVIPNPVQVRAESAPADSNDVNPKKLERKHLVAMGRLDPQKGFDLLIDAFAQLADEHADWSLKILGEGPQREILQRQIDERGLQKRVALAGWCDDPPTVLRRADLFVLCSRFEGFPNALLEAMACGLPAVAFDCPSGPAEIIRDGVDGLLVPPENARQLAAALNRLMSDEALRRRLAARAPGVHERFGEDRFFEQWDGVLAACTANGIR